MVFFKFFLLSLFCLAFIPTMAYSGSYSLWDFIDFFYQRFAEIFLLSMKKLYVSWNFENSQQFSVISKFNLEYFNLN